MRLLKERSLRIRCVGIIVFFNKDVRQAISLKRVPVMFIYILLLWELLILYICELKMTQ